MFSKTERLLIRFDVHGSVPASATLTNRQGARIVDLPVTPAQASGNHQIEFGLSFVPSGEYLVEIAIKDATTQSRELVALRVGA